LLVATPKSLAALERITLVRRSGFMLARLSALLAVVVCKLFTRRQSAPSTAIRFLVRGAIAVAVTKMNDYNSVSILPLITVN
jgi:hypothetical protein